MPGHELGYPDFPEAQMLAVEALCEDILQRHRIPPQRVLAHSGRCARAARPIPGKSSIGDGWQNAGIGIVGRSRTRHNRDEGSRKIGDEGEEVCKAAGAICNSSGYGFDSTAAPIVTMRLMNCGARVSAPLAAISQRRRLRVTRFDDAQNPRTAVRRIAKRQANAQHLRFVSGRERFFR